MTLLILLSGLIPFGSLSYAQKLSKIREKFAPDSATFTMAVDPKQDFSQGKTFEAKIHFKIGKHWHVYSSKSNSEASSPLILQIPSELGSNFQLESFEEKGKVTAKFDSNFMATTKAFYSDFDIVAKIKIRSNAKLGKDPFYLWMNYQTCNESNCIPANTFTVPMLFLGKDPLQISVAKGSGIVDAADTTAVIDTSSKLSAAIPATPAPPPPGSTSNGVTADDLNKIAGESIWSFILTAMGFGLLALVTPCVFPMIPITVSFFTKRNQGSKKHAVKDATFYAIGIIVTFVVLGFLLALLFGSSGINKFASNPAVNILIALIFIAFALNLFGLYELGVPNEVLNKLHVRATTHENQIVSVILMGFVFSLTSFTCTVPFVGTLMVSFSRGQWFVPLIGMTVFASVFALPFFLLALFPSAIKALPKSGGWLNSVKVVMGFLEIAAAMKFISNVDLVFHWHIFTRDFVIATWMAIAIITTLYLLGRFNLPHDTPSPHIGPIRAVFSIIFLTCGIYLFTGFGNKPLGEVDAFLPPSLDDQGVATASLAPQINQGSNTTKASLYWYPRLNEALAEAKHTGKNVFIDFTGYQCTNCRAMESSIFKRPEVIGLFKDFILARLYTDDGSPLNDSNRTMEEVRFSTIAQPYYVILSPDDKPLATFPGYTRDLDAFITFLKPHSRIDKQVALK
ncbi:MAG: cytochrome c biogenesis protein CcdA [Bacteroidota bacterium]|nr:cytochrome c biogenesis protein CcdA [Bacteroidota bacterium]